jgi:hypothetical protein
VSGGRTGMDPSPSGHLPSYSDDAVRAALLAAGASGTIYSLVMPESEAALSYVVDGGERGRREALFDRYHEPWTRKQDAMHEDYFTRWLSWAAPVVAVDAAAFPFRYPTAGASEGIFKLTAEYAAECRAAGREPVVHIFEGEYEGFPAYADALALRTIRHDRAAWQAAPAAITPHGLFWISQPSAIDGMAWPHFEAFAAAVAAARPDVRIVPDLTYVGSVAREIRIALDSPNIPAFVISHSKPFGGYYHRVGGVFSRAERPSLFGNKWFKNLQSLAWATEMMTRHGVFELPRKYRLVQEEAARRVGNALGIAGLAPADVLLLATAPASGELAPPLDAVLRGSPDERVVRLCLTPAMTCLIDPQMARTTAPALLARWAAAP